MLTKTQAPMKPKHILLYAVIILMVFNLVSCTALKDSPTKMVTDPVCNMQVSTSEGFKWKYKDQTCYFDSYNCRESFKMDPEGILKKNNCQKAK